MNRDRVCVGTFRIKQNDRAPSLAFQYTLSDGTPIDLSGYDAVKCAMVSADAPYGPAKMNAAAVFVDKPTGKVRYDWGAGDLDTPGDYDAEFQATAASQSPLTCPGNGYIRVVVLREVAT